MRHTLRPTPASRPPYLCTTSVTFVKRWRSAQVVPLPFTGASYTWPRGAAWRSPRKGKARQGAYAKRFTRRSKYAMKIFKNIQRRFTVNRATTTVSININPMRFTHAIRIYWQSEIRPDKPSDPVQQPQPSQPGVGPQGTSSFISGTWGMRIFPTKNNVSRTHFQPPRRGHEANIDAKRCWQGSTKNENPWAVFPNQTRLLTWFLTKMSASSDLILFVITFIIGHVKKCKISQQHRPKFLAFWSYFLSLKPLLMLSLTSSLIRPAAARPAQRRHGK